jgi:hypothetical protein
MDLGTRLRLTAERFPENTAIVDGAIRLPYAIWDAQVNAAAHVVRAFKKTGMAEKTMRNRPGIWWSWADRRSRGPRLRSRRTPERPNHRTTEPGVPR